MPRPTILSAVIYQRLISKVQGIFQTFVPPKRSQDTEDNGTIAYVQKWICSCLRGESSAGGQQEAGHTLLWGRLSASLWC